MAPTRMATLLVLALLAATPAVLAHGAAPPREIDTRLLADDDGLFPFGFCLEGTCAAQNEALDLVVLEVREAHLADEPALVFRVIAQAPDQHAGRSIEVHLTAAGQEREFSYSTTDAGVENGNFDRVAGPFDAFDGYPKAVDAYLLYSTLGIKVGDALTAIEVHSGFEGEEGDVMPGTWYANGQEVPFAPNPEGELEQAEPGSYTLKGPAELLTMASSHEAVHLASGVATINVTFTNPLTSLAQFANLTLTMPGGVVATLAEESLALDPGASRTISLRIASATVPANVTLAATTDIGGFQRLTFAVMPPPQASSNATTGHGSGHGEGHESSSSSSPAKSAPAPLALVAVALALLTARRLRL